MCSEHEIIYFMLEESEIKTSSFFFFLITKVNFRYSRNKIRDSMNYFDISQIVWFPFSYTDGVGYNPTAWRVTDFNKHLFSFL